MDVILTEHRSQDHEPGADVRQRFDDLVLLQVLVLCTALVVPDALKGSDTFLLRQDAGVYRRIRQPHCNAESYDNRKATKENIDDLVRCE